MKKYFILTVLFLLAGVQVLAMDSDELMERFKAHRSKIYKELNLTSEQIADIQKIDEKVYIKLEPELKQMAFNINKIEEIAASEDCTIKKVKAVKKDFKSIEKRISYIKKSYNKEFSNVLTQEQKVLYKTAKENLQLEQKKEIEELKKQLNN